MHFLHFLLKSIIYLYYINNGFGIYSPRAYGEGVRRNAKTPKSWANRPLRSISYKYLTDFIIKKICNIVDN